MSHNSATEGPTARPDGLVLAGGAGTRVGGRDKGLMPFNGRPAVEAAIDVLAQHCGRVFISANRNLDVYAAMPAAGVITDQRPEHAGPLAGLEALQAVKVCETLLLLPCDSPGIEASIYRRLLEVLNDQPDIDVCYARSARGNHYLVAALRRSALAEIPRLLDSGQQAVRAWLQTVRCESVEFSDREAESLRNMNALADWET